MFHISQGSVAMHWRCGGMFSNHFITNFPQNVLVEKFWESVNMTKIWTKLCGLLFWATRYIHLRFDKKLSLSLPQISQKVNPCNILISMFDEICYNTIATYSWRNISMINLLPKYLSSESKTNYDNLLQWLLFQNYRKRLKYFEWVHYLCKQGCTFLIPCKINKLIFK